ncbi:hypothetical protein ACP9OK_15895 [Pseudomonas sp. B11]
MGTVSQKNPFQIKEIENRVKSLKSISKPGIALTYCFILRKILALGGATKNTLNI